MEEKEEPPRTDGENKDLGLKKTKENHVFRFYK